MKKIENDAVMHPPPPSMQYSRGPTQSSLFFFFFCAFVVTMGGWSKKRSSVERKRENSTFKCPVFTCRERESVILCLWGRSAAEGEGGGVHHSQLRVQRHLHLMCKCSGESSSTLRWPWGTVSLSFSLSLWTFYEHCLSLETFSFLFFPKNREKENKYPTLQENHAERKQRERFLATYR